MSAAVVTTSGSLSCAHPPGSRTLDGLAQDPAVKLRVGTSPVVAVTSVNGSGDYAGCPTVDGAANKHPCRSTTVTSTGAARLTVGGRPVLTTADAISTTNDLLATFPNAGAVDGQAPKRLTAS